MRRLFTLCCTALLALALAPLTASAATDVTGTWTGTMQGGGGDIALTFTFKQDAGTLTGTVQGAQGDPLPIADGKVDGDKITFNVVFQGTTISHEGTVNGDEMKLSSKSSDGSFPANTLTLKRAKAAAAQ